MSVQDSDRNSCLQRAQQRSAAAEQKASIATVTSSRRSQNTIRKVQTYTAINLLMILGKKIRFTSTVARVDGVVGERLSCGSDVAGRWVWRRGLWRGI